MNIDDKIKQFNFQCKKINNKENKLHPIFEKILDNILKAQEINFKNDNTSKKL